MLSVTHLLLILVAVVIFFGLGKLPSAMGDIGRGIRSFKDGLRDDSDDKDKITPPDDKK
jgi:sec-independent protein translocase protein TatA